MARVRTYTEASAASQAGVVGRLDELAEWAAAEPGEMPVFASEVRASEVRASEVRLSAEWYYAELERLAPDALAAVRAANAHHRQARPGRPPVAYLTGAVAAQPYWPAQTAPPEIVDICLVYGAPWDAHEAWACLRALAEALQSFYGDSGPGGYRALYPGGAPHKMSVEVYQGLYVATVAARRAGGQEVVHRAYRVALHARGGPADIVRAAEAPQTALAADGAAAPHTTPLGVVALAQGVVVADRAVFDDAYCRALAGAAQKSCYALAFAEMAAPGAAEKVIRLPRAVFAPAGSGRWNITFAAPEAPTDLSPLRREALAAVAKRAPQRDEVLRHNLGQFVAAGAAAPTRHAAALYVCPVGEFTRWFVGEEYPETLGRLMPPEALLREIAQVAEESFDGQRLDVAKAAKYLGAARPGRLEELARLACALAAAPDTLPARGPSLAEALIQGACDDAQARAAEVSAELGLDPAADARLREVCADYGTFSVCGARRTALVEALFAPDRAHLLEAYERRRDAKIEWWLAAPPVRAEAPGRVKACDWYGPEHYRAKLG
jgi:hypothetical protein